MKKLLIFGAIALVVMGCVLAAGCTSTNNGIPNGMTFNFEPTGTEYEQFYDLGNYIILLKEKQDIDVSAALEKIRTTDGYFLGGCSASAKLNKDGEVIMGRNMDLPVTEYPAFISINTFGKYKTLSITYASTFQGKLNCQKYEDLLKEGKLDEEFYNLIPLLAFDAFNEKGLYIESNMRDGNVFLNNYGTNPGKEEADLQSLPTLVATECANVKEALEFIRNEYSWVTHFANTGDPMDNWNAAFMIGDAEGEYGLIEIANDQVNYIPYQPGQTNYYLSPVFSALSTYDDGVSRLQVIYDHLMEPQTAEEMQKMMECAYISNYQLNNQYAYRDENGKIQFVDKDGNPIMDWRGEYVLSLDKIVPIDENGNIISETGYEEGCLVYLLAEMIGDTETMKKYQSDYDKYKEYLDKYKESSDQYAVSAIYDDKNFEEVQRFVVLFDKMFGISDLLSKYYAGDEMPLRKDTSGNVWIACLNVGVNCAQKYCKVKFWENDNLEMTFRW